MRIAHPALFEAARSAGLAQGWNQARDRSAERALRSSLGSRGIAAENARHAAELALRLDEISRQGKLAERRMDLDEMMARRSFEVEDRKDAIDRLRAEIEGKRTDLLDKEIGLKYGIARDELALRRSEMERDAEREAARRAHELDVLERQHRQQRSMAELGSILEQNAEGVGGWRHEARLNEELLRAAAARELAKLQGAISSALQRQAGDIESSRQASADARRQAHEWALRAAGMNEALARERIASQAQVASDRMKLLGEYLINALAPTPDLVRQYANIHGITEAQARAALTYQAMVNAGF